MIKVITVLHSHHVVVPTALEKVGIKELVYLLLNSHAFLLQ